MAKSRVYRNLHTGRWSIKQWRENGWRVTGHADSCILRETSVWLSEKSRQRCLKLGVRNVHCFVVGELVAVGGLHPFKGRRTSVQYDDELAHGIAHRKAKGITYNPYQNQTMVYREDGTAYHGSLFAEFTRDQKMIAR